MAGPSLSGLYIVSNGLVKCSMLFLGRKLTVFGCEIIEARGRRHSGMWGVRRKELFGCKHWSFQGRTDISAKDDSCCLHEFTDILLNCI